MKKLKKLTRKGLDELANEMPQVNEIQQREFVGGTTFYSFNGSVVHQRGTSTDIELIDHATVTDWDTASGFGMYEMGDSAALNVIQNFTPLVPNQSGLSNLQISFQDITCITLQSFGGMPILIVPTHGTDSVSGLTAFFSTLQL